MRTVVLTKQCLSCEMSTYRTQGFAKLHIHILHVERFQPRATFTSNETSGISWSHLGVIFQSTSSSSFQKWTTFLTSQRQTYIDCKVAKQNLYLLAGRSPNCFGDVRRQKQTLSGRAAYRTSTQLDLDWGCTLVGSAWALLGGTKTLGWGAGWRQRKLAYWIKEIKEQDYCSFKVQSQAGNLQCETTDGILAITCRCNILTRPVRAARIRIIWFSQQSSPPEWGIKTFIIIYGLKKHKKKREAKTLLTKWLAPFEVRCTCIEGGREM